jgi:hypothetical protein
MRHTRKGAATRLFTEMRESPQTGGCRRTGKQAFAVCRERHSGFGPVFAAEKPEEEKGIRTSTDMLRIRLAKEGLRKGKRNRRACRSRRERRACFGEPLQLDGRGPQQEKRLCAGMC